VAIEAILLFQWIGEERPSNNESFHALYNRNERAPDKLEQSSRGGIRRDETGLRH